VKRRGSTDVDDWYAIMPAAVWAELLTMIDFGMVSPQPKPDNTPNQ
jgi:hypothetical protein